VFRHGISAVPTSRIAEQYYCEQKVELGYLQGRVETESMQEGQELHEQLIPMQKATLKRIVRGIKREPVFVASFPIVAEFSQLVLVGVPDAVVFVKGNPGFVIELKTTRGDTSRLWDDQIVQARVYGLILEQMGFDCSGLKLVIPRVRRTRQARSWKSTFLNSVIQDLLKEPSTQPRKRKESTIHIIDYNRAHAVADVKWTEAYWLSRRQPIPSGSPAKCGICEYGEVCSHASMKKS
jgi:CRISPR/Cas system-associated exonuclease Cas4 (RecB family)